MPKLTYYTPRSPLARLLAQAASYFPPRALRPIVKPCVRLCRHSRRPTRIAIPSPTTRSIARQALCRSAGRA